MTQFLLNRNGIHAATDAHPNTTILQYLRSHSLFGTKEGCASGDCGACTVVVGELTDNGWHYRHINGCITLLASLHGKHLITVDGLRDDNGGLHPVQQAMVNAHGSQCGFCTPGFVMSLFAMYRNRVRADRETVCHGLSGNLCRCTGYRPIIDAALSVLSARVDDVYDAYADTASALIATIDTEQRHQVITNDGRYLAPNTIAELTEALAAHADARLIAGGTDLALEITQQCRILPTIIDVGRVSELHRLQRDDTMITIGAAVRYSDCHPLLSAEYPSLDAMLLRLGSQQIRHQGTIAGNIGNASPIGDMPPVLLALDASVTLVSVRGERRVALDRFFVDYRKTVRANDECIAFVHMPLLRDNEFFRVYKISKRFDDDISAVLAAIKLTVTDDDSISDARIAYGGMAATPKRAIHVEKALIGKALTPATIATAQQAMGSDFAPMSDMRASADYRMQVAQNLLMRCYHDYQQHPTTVTEYDGTYA